MINKLILIILVVTGLYGYNSFYGEKPQSLPSVVPDHKITRQAEESLSQTKALILRNLPGKENWPAPVKTMYHMIFMEEIINPIKEQNSYLPLESLSMNLQHAVIAIEDHDFYQHSAISINSIIRAIIINSSAEEVQQGGSTITQQLVKNLFLSNEQSISRKMLEAMLALMMESKYSKDEILELYLNTTYFGMGCYGANQASDKLFRKAPIIMRPEEAALLAAMMNAPSSLDPYKNPDGAKARQEIVLEEMQHYGYITQQQCRKAKTADIYLRNNVVLRYKDKMAL